jgi:hypothetical protein
MKGVTDLLLVGHVLAQDFEGRRIRAVCPEAGELLGLLAVWQDQLEVVNIVEDGEVEVLPGRDK